MNAELESAKQDLIDTITWYRDEYHRNDFCHTKMIEDVKQVTSLNQLDDFWLIVDGWLD